MRRVLAIAGMMIASAAALRAGASPDPRGVTEGRLSAAAQEVLAFRDAGGSLPRSSDGIGTVVSSRESLVDAWGNDVVYLRVAGGFWLISFGADGAPGGTGDAADVVYMAN